MVKEAIVILLWMDITIPSNPFKRKLSPKSTVIYLPNHHLCSLVWDHECPPEHKM